MVETLKEKLEKNKLTIGSWITIGHPTVAELMLQAPFEWLVVDLEHSAITLDAAQVLISTIEGGGRTPLVRVGENNQALIKRVMDLGAHGVIVPMVNSKEDAKRAVDSVKYPPVGKRGVGLYRAQKYGEGFEEYKKWLADESVVIVQIEHIDAVKNIEEILKVKGVDGCIIGPYDLSASLGIPGKFDDKRMKNALERVREACRRLKKPLGFHVVPPDHKLLQQKIDEGYTFLAFSLDFMFLGAKCREELAKVKR